MNNDERVILIINNAEFICYYTEKQLFLICYENGRRLIQQCNQHLIRFEPPFVVQNLVHCQINNQNDILFIKGNGELRIKNFFKRQSLLESDISFLLNEQQQMQDLKLNDKIYFDNNANLYIFINTNFIYFYSKIYENWQRLASIELDLEIFNQPLKQSLQSSMIIEKSVKENMETFFTKLGAENQQQSLFQQQTNFKIISSLEEKLSIFQQTDDIGNFLKCSFQYVQKLCQFKEINRLRQFLQDLFINNSKKEALFLKRQTVQQKDVFDQIFNIITEYTDLQEFQKEIQELFVQFK